VRNNSCCPTFLVATAGAWLAVLGGVFTDKWIVQRLTDFVRTGLDTPFAEAHCRQMARTMYALRRNVERLEKYYEALDLHPDAHEYLHPSVFPSITTFLDKTGNTTPFKYVRPLEDEPGCVAFHAKTIGSSPMDVVIKFVERYGEEAHQVLAKEHLAPQLLYCGRVGIHDDDPTFGELRMVVMEYVDGETLHEVKRVPPSAKEEVARALEILHDKDYAFGDLRRQNVMITRNEEVKLVDFDWAGKENETRYPLLASKAITGPLGVEGGSLIKKSHDIHMYSLLW
jgi:serine/threonine protein kinase